MVALPPSMTRLRRTSGVRPILKELSSKTFNSDLPVQNIFILLLAPAAEQTREGGLVDDLRDGQVHLFPHVVEGRVDVVPRTMLALLRPFHEAQDFAHRDGLRGARQKVTALRASPRLHEAALFQARQN